jgi:hypothetical protein
MLWSKSLVEADNICPRQSVDLRAGVKGSSWDGFNVGSHVHNCIRADALGEAQPNGHHLTIHERTAAQKMLQNFAEMDLEIPSDALVELSYISEIVGNGETSGWGGCPEWADRGDYWDPLKAGDKTLFRIQPDVWFINEAGNIVVYDWKTSWGIPSEASLNADAQAILYCAALCQMNPDVEEAEFVWWNIRYQTGHMVKRSAAEWVELARPIWIACHDKDQVSVEELRGHERPGEHCGRCPYATTCLTEEFDYQRSNDAQLYRHSKKVAALAKKVREDLSSRLKARTGVLHLEDGTKLGPARSHFRKWKRGEKFEALRKVLSNPISGVDVFDLFDVKGSLGDWISSLPDELMDIVEPHLDDGYRQVFVERD